MRMKLFCMLIGFIISMGFLGGVSNAVLMNDTDLWRQTDEWDLFIIQVSGRTDTGFDLYVYDSDQEYSVLGDDTTRMSLSLRVYEDNGNYYLGTYNKTTGAIIEDLLDLGSSGFFGFYFTVDGTRTYSYTMEYDTDSDSYYLSVDDGNFEVSVSDAAPVPLPSTARLLGIGVVGLMSLELRRKRTARLTE